MIEPEENIFRLQWVPDDVEFTLDTTPTNWGDMEMGLQREFLAIKREVTNALTFDSEASQAITNAMNGNYLITLTLLRKQNDWTMLPIRTWSADMKTYKTSRGMVSISFKSSTAREEIEQNKGTKYDIPLGASNLSYSGIDIDTTDVVSGVIKKVTDGSPLHYSPSNWLIFGNHSTVSSTELSFSNFKVTSLVAKPVTVSVKVGSMVMYMPSDECNIFSTLMLIHYRNGNVVSHLHTWSYPHLGIGPSGTTYLRFEDYTYRDSTVTMAIGDDICLIYSTSDRPSYINITSAPDLRMQVSGFEVSPYTDYPIQVDTMPTLITALLAKMCVTAPTLTYNLTENVNFLPVLSSAQGLSQTPNPIITVSFEDIMKCLFMLHGADYEVLDGAGDDLILDIRPMTDLMSNTQAEVLEAVNGIEVTRSNEHVYGTVKVGYETDENAKNGQYDPMCINTFKLGDSDAELDLVCPFKASPTTIEAFIKDKKTSSSTTKDSDTSVFLFCAYLNIDGDYRLYRGHRIISTPTPYLVNANYFNIPYTPMRILTNVGRYLKVSRWNNAEPIEFISTERTAQLTSNLFPNYLVYVSEDTPSVDQRLSMERPLFLPFDVDFEAETEPFTKDEINGNPRKYYTITDIITGETYNLYINDLTLPLTKRKTATFTGLLKYDMPT